MSNVKQISTFLRAASFIPSSYKEDDNTIELVAATEAEVLTRTWEYGTFKEILSMKKGQVRLDRLNARAQVLDNHNSYGSVLTTVFGVVENARLENNELIVKIRFSSREDLKPFIEDVKNGIYCNISVQYRVYKYEITEEEGQIPIYRATDWEPYEVSFVSVPADFNAGTRSQQKVSTNEVELISLNRNIMSDTNKGGAPAPEGQTRSQDPATPSGTATTTTNTVDIEAERKAGAKAAQKRSSDILNAVRAAGFDADFAQTLIDDENMTVDSARAAIIDKISQSRSQTQQIRNNGPVVVVGEDEADKFRGIVSDALVLRSGHIKEKDFKPEVINAAREYRGVTLLRLAEECLERAGIKVKGLGKMELAGRALSSTSDFGVILENVMHKLLLAQYNIVSDTWRNFCAIGTVSDFRAHSRYRMGSFGKLDPLGENSEYKHKAISDAEKASVTASTYGNIIDISRAMIINDDLGAFTNLAAGLGRAAARSIEIDVYALLASNPVMQDGVALFHASHGNLMTGAAPSVVAFDAIRVAMALQKDPSGNDILDLRPEVLLIGMSQGGDAKVINDAQYDPDTANKLQKPNKARGIFNNIVDTGRITGNEYYAFANPNEVPVLEVDFLDGVQTPFMESWQEKKTDGLAWKVRLDYGVNAVDWRGAIKNPGA